MRPANVFPALIVFILLLGASCGRTETNRLTIEAGTVERIEGCHIKMHYTVTRDDDRFAAFNYACGVPESALKEKDWWGAQTQPLGFSMRVGECLLLNETFYCVDNIEPDRVSLKPTYKWATRHHDHLELIR